jgi:hypothetical protein
MIGNKKFFITVIVFFSITFPSMSTASNVYWGGVSFSSWEQKDQLYPNISKFLCRADNCLNGNIDLWARKYLDNFKSKNFEISMDLISGNEVEGIIMTPMISKESVNIVKDITGNKVNYIHVYRIYASMMFFEFSTGRFIASRPIIVQYTDTKNQPEKEAEQSVSFRKLLDGSLENINLFNEVFSASIDVKPFTFSNRLIRVSTIDVSDEALKEIDNVDIQSWKESIQKQTEAFLVKNTNAPFVPSISNDSATEEFSATFANAARTIKLPSDVAFNVGIHIKKLKPIVKVNLKQQTVCHAVSLTLFADGLLDRVFEVNLVRTKESCGVISSDKQIDHAYYLTQSIFSILSEASRSMGGSLNMDFIKRSGGKNFKTNKKMFKKAYSEVFKSDF